MEKIHDNMCYDNSFYENMLVCLFTLAQTQTTCT